MKKYIKILFVTIILLNLTPLVQASTNSKNVLDANNYYNGKSFTFIEAGITFSVFQNGEFDFYINNSDGIQSNVNFGLVSVSYNSGYNYDAYLQYDDYGAIIQIENVPIYYDYYGKVRQVGNIKINYYSNRISRIGGLYVYYNSYGYYSHYSGYINYYNRYYAYHPYDRYFVHPSYNRVIVSYNPYRHNYYPTRYSYGKHATYYRKHNSYKKMDSKIRYADSRRKSGNYQKRSRNNLAYNNDRVTGRKNTRNASYSTRKVKSNTIRKDLKTRDNTRSSAINRKNVNYRNNIPKKTRQNEIANRSNYKKVSTSSKNRVRQIKTTNRSNYRKVSTTPKNRVKQNKMANKSNYKRSVPKKKQVRSSSKRSIAYRN